MWNTVKEALGIKMYSNGGWWMSKRHFCLFCLFCLLISSTFLWEFMRLYDEAVAKQSAIRMKVISHL